MIRRPPISKRTGTLVPYTTRFRSALGAGLAIVEGALVVVDGQLAGAPHCHRLIVRKPLLRAHDLVLPDDRIAFIVMPRDNTPNLKCHSDLLQSWVVVAGEPAKPGASSEPGSRSEEHTSELPSLMRISYAVFCLKTKN